MVKVFINVTSCTCAFSAITDQSVGCEKGLQSLTWNLNLHTKRYSGILNAVCQLSVNEFVNLMLKTGTYNLALLVAAKNSFAKKTLLELLK